MHGPGNVTITNQRHREEETQNTEATSQLK